MKKLVGRVNQVLVPCRYEAVDRRRRYADYADSKSMSDVGRCPDV